MRLGHSLSLALAGFILIVPPMSHGARFDKKVPLVDAEAPVSKWKAKNFFDSEASCQQQQREVKQKAAQQAKSEPDLVKGRSGRAAHLLQNLSAQCVRDDDPGLKAK